MLSSVEAAAAPSHQRAASPSPLRPCCGHPDGGRDSRTGFGLRLPRGRGLSVAFHVLMEKCQELCLFFSPVKI